jgi:ABC-type branched-subunit amino acid transport system substrate-binding protein
MDSVRGTSRSSKRSPKLSSASRRTAVVSIAVVALVGAACSSTTNNGSASASTTAPASSGTSASAGAPSPGVTPTSVTVGQVDDLTLPLPGLFKGAEDGTQAYFDYINSIGGVNGRKIKLDAADSLYNEGTVANATAAQIQNDFALVGGFSLDDSAEEPLVKSANMPDIAYPLDPGLSNLPTAYSPFPNGDSDAPTTIFKILKKKFPTQIKHVGILWANATPSTAIAEKAFERAAKAEGFDIVYDASFSPIQTTFLPNVLKMKAEGVQMFFSQQLPDTYAETVAKEMSEQNFHPINVEEDAYTSDLVKAGGPSVQGMYISVGFALYLGADTGLPAVKLFTKWMKKADPTANFELEALFGWASAELFVDGLRQAGSPPTRAGLEAALDKVTSFTAGGLLSDGDPAQNVPSACVLLAQVKGAAIVRVPPSPAKGFYCLAHSLLPSAGFKPEVRPAPPS